VRKIRRLRLRQATRQVLKELRVQIANAADPKAEANRLWNNKTNSRPRSLAFEDMRNTLERMAPGRTRCMYCEDSAGTDIEHFWPRSRYYKRTFSWGNYLLACSHCNSNKKRDLFPFQAGKPALINPCVDEPADHLTFVPSTGEFKATGPKGESSRDVFGLNDDEAPRRLPSGRKDTFRKLQLLLLDYEAEISSGDKAAASYTKGIILREPFSAVLFWLTQISAKPGGALVLRAGVPRIIQTYKVARWL
jgi:uncharacterized protein (TIGR02646 family)